MDKSLIIWEPDETVGIWFAKVISSAISIINWWNGSVKCAQVRLGEVGGPVAGFYGAKYNPDGTIVVAHSFLGGLHCWKLDQQVKSSVIITENQRKTVLKLI